MTTFPIGNKAELHGIRRVVFLPVCAVVGGQADTRDMKVLAPDIPRLRPVPIAQQKPEARLPAENDEDMADGGERQTRVIRIHPFEPASAAEPAEIQIGLSVQCRIGGAQQRHGIAAVLHGAREKIGSGCLRLSHVQPLRNAIGSGAGHYVGRGIEPERGRLRDPCRKRRRGWVRR